MYTCIPPFPQLKVDGVGRWAARQGPNVDTSTLGLGERGARQVHHAVVVVILLHCLAAIEAALRRVADREGRRL